VATFFTLEYDGVEKSFADWGFEQDSAEFQEFNMAVDLFAVAMPGARVDDDPVFPFEAEVVVRKGRTFGGGVYSGGVIEFQGKRLMHILDGRPESEGVIYQFGGPWYDISQTPYQQTVYSYSGDPDAPNEDLVSNLVLFQKVTAPGVTEARNNGEQISDILQHLLDQYVAQSMTAPYQIGTIDPAVNLMTYQTKDIKCDEAIGICLRPSPDAKVWFDYSTSTPTVHVRFQANCAAASVAFADGVNHESMQLKPRYDLQARSVVLYFEQSNTEDGFTWLQRTKQKYPLDGVEGGLRVLLQTIDLAGFNVSNVTGSLTCSAVANTLTWWKKYIPELQSSKVASFSVGAMTIKDESGTAVSLATYPNVLDDGNIAPWMKLTGGAAVNGVKVTITAIASYDQNDANGQPVMKFVAKELQARVTLTNGITGAYSTTASAVEAEAIPTGLAEAIYNSLATLQYEGTVQIVEQECSGSVGMGNVLNLTGGRAEWETMNALVQGVSRKYGTGQTRITIGPAKHLSAGELTQLFLINRNRRVWTNPALQGSPQLSNGAVALADKTTKENTMMGLEEKSLLVVSAVSGGNEIKVKNDAANGKIHLGVFTSTGALAGSTSSALMDLAGLEPDGTHRQAGWVWLYFQDSKDSCSAKKMLVFGCSPEADV
jgi:hypothetical protein